MVIYLYIFYFPFGFLFALVLLFPIALVALFFGLSLTHSFERCEFKFRKALSMWMYIYVMHALRVVYVFTRFNSIAFIANFKQGIFHTIDSVKNAYTFVKPPQSIMHEICVFMNVCVCVHTCRVLLGLFYIVTNCKRFNSQNRWLIELRIQSLDTNAYYAFQKQRPTKRKIHRKNVRSIAGLMQLQYPGFTIGFMGKNIKNLAIWLCAWVWVWVYV